MFAYDRLPSLRFGTLLGTNNLCPTFDAGLCTTSRSWSAVVEAARPLYPYSLRGGRSTAEPRASESFNWRRQAGVLPIQFNSFDCSRGPAKATHFRDESQALPASALALKQQSLRMLPVLARGHRMTTPASTADAPNKVLCKEALREMKQVDSQFCFPASSREWWISP